VGLGVIGGLVVGGVIVGHGVGAGVALFVGI